MLSTRILRVWIFSMVEIAFRSNVLRYGLASSLSANLCFAAVAILAAGLEYRTGEFRGMFG